MGLHQRLCIELASVDLDFAHGGLLALWNFSRRPSSDESVSSCRKYTAVVPRTETPNPLALAKPARGRVVRLASASRRIGRMDRRAQGCSQHILPAADVAGLCEIRGGVQGPK